MKNQIEKRLAFLELGLEEIRNAYSDTLKDCFLELGGRYGESYFENSIDDKVKDLNKKREDILYYRIFCFSQVVFSLKDYLKENYPGKSKRIERFFTRKKINGLSKVILSNDLKHNPKFDLVYGFVKELDEKVEIVGNSKNKTIKLKKTWEYRGLDSISFCESIFDEVLKFVNLDFEN